MNRLNRLLRELAAGVTAVTLGLTPPPLRAQDGIGKEPGTRLLARCEAARRLAGPGGSAGLSADQLADAQACLGFIDGFVWGHAWASWRGAKDMWFCLPEGFSTREGIPVVLDYLEAHPDRLSEDAHLLVFLALTAAYPCVP
ncbi:MAG TPA: Rap1a/Tai family immunity protein [Burkholderiales bacterium]|nr:Rap1a/Tai family immunity protein [Burkholderiales bacterium]